MSMRVELGPVLASVLLGMICVAAVTAEKITPMPPASAGNSAGEVEITKVEQAEEVKIQVTDLDRLQLELAREISIGKQASELKELAGSFADLPPEAVTALLEHGGIAGRLQRTVEALQIKRQSAKPSPTKPSSTKPSSTKPRCQEPKLTAGHIAYIEVAQGNRGGRVVIRLGQSSYSVAVGESFDIRQPSSCNRQYTVVAIRYLTPSKIELQLRTEQHGISKLIKDI